MKGPGRARFFIVQNEMSIALNSSLCLRGCYDEALHYKLAEK